MQMPHACSYKWQETATNLASELHAHTSLILNMLEVGAFRSKQFATNLIACIRVEAHIDRVAYHLRSLWRVASR